MLLNCSLSTFPAYFISAGYISFPAFSRYSWLYYLALPFYYWEVASNKVFACCTEAYVMHPDSILLYVQSSHNYNTLVLAAD